MAIDYDIFPQPGDNQDERDILRILNTDENPENVEYARFLLDFHGVAIEEVAKRPDGRPWYDFKGKYVAPMSQEQILAIIANMKENA